MMTRDVAKRFIKHVEAMNFLSAFNMLAEDGKYVVIGTTDISGTYNGRSDVIDKLGSVFARFVDLPVLKFEEPIVDGARAVLLAGGAGRGPFGPYEQPHYAFVATIVDEEIREIIEFMDTGALESALFGRKLINP